MYDNACLPKRSSAYIEEHLLKRKKKEKFGEESDDGSRRRHRVVEPHADLKGAEQHCGTTLNVRRVQVAWAATSSVNERD